MPASRRFTEVAAALAAALFLVSWGLLHVGWYDDGEIVDIPVYELYGNAIEIRRGALSGHPAGVPAGSAPRVRPAGAPE